MRACAPRYVHSTAITAARRACGSRPHRDVGEVRALRQPMKKFHDYLGAVAGDLAASLHSAGANGIALTLRHAVQFETWHSLSAQGASDAAIADLVVVWVSALTRQSR